MSSTENLYESVEPIAVLRKRFLFLTENNYCAAFILDRFVATIASREEEAFFDRNPIDYRIKISILSITNKLFGMFTQQDVANALHLLINRRYIHDQNDGSEDSHTFVVNRKKIDQDSDIYRKQTNQAWQEIKTQYQLQQDLYAGQEASTEDPIEIEIISPPQQGQKNEPNKYRRNENKRVEYHRNRASRVGLPATLTTSQWQKTLEHYNNQCAFCAEGKYEVLEHFIPLIHGGGTTEYNCIPACAQCNRLKNDVHPSMISSELSLFKMIKNIQEYLEMRRRNPGQEGGGL